jgi:hypothetical protein
MQALGQKNTTKADQVGVDRMLILRKLSEPIGVAMNTEFTERANWCRNEYGK